VAGRGRPRRIGGYAVSRHKTRHSGAAAGGTGNPDFLRWTLDSGFARTRQPERLHEWDRDDVRRQGGAPSIWTIWSPPPDKPQLACRGRHALVAQLDRASDFESEGREFESLRARQRLVLIELVDQLPLLGGPRRRLNEGEEAGSPCARGRTNEASEGTASRSAEKPSKPHGRAQRGTRGRRRRLPLGSGSPSDAARAAIP
jgi:hypothetical protein